VTGAAIYTIDMALPNMAHGGILRSPYAHARILSIDTAEAEAVPGVIAVITAKDTPDLKYGRAIHDRYVMAREKVFFTGDAVAAVVAESPSIVRRALRKIRVEYEPLPVLLDPEEAMRPEAPVLHPDMPPPASLPKDAQVRNVCGYYSLHLGDPDAAMASADLVVEERYETQMAHPQYLEPKAVVAQRESDGGLTIWTSCQSPFVVRSEISRLLQVPINKVRIIVPDIGGGFGGKSGGVQSAGALEPICALLAMKAERPVMMVLDKAEETVATTVRAPSRVWIQTGVMNDGTIVARKARLILDAGAYSGSGPLAASGATTMLAGWYRIPNVHIDGYVVNTNKPVCGSVRGPGGIQATFPVESHMDSIAAKLGMDPVAFRLKNAHQSGDTDAAGYPLGAVSLSETIRIAAERIGWGTVQLKPNQGIGFACCTWGHGPGAGGGAIVKVNEDGSATVLMGKVDYGTAIRFALPMIVAEELGLNFEDVTVLNVDTDTSPWDFGTVGSMTTLVAGEATRQAAIDARHQLFRIAARRLNASPDDLEAVDRQIRVRSDPQRALPINVVATAAHFEVGEVIGRGYFDAQAEAARAHAEGFSPDYATHAALVEVDPDTGRVNVLKYVAVHDIGFAIHPDAVQGQIEGGVVQGLGQALCEQILVDEQGRNLNPTFVDYLLITTNIAPEIETVLVEGYPGMGPYGAKGIGEVPCLPPPAAVANAIYNAVGVRVRTLPLTPERVLRALRERD
jgi:CO/xanthine dehydrogenase Mo-binding subunit